MYIRWGGGGPNLTLKGMCSGNWKGNLVGEEYFEDIFCGSVLLMCCFCKLSVCPVFCFESCVTLKLEKIWWKIIFWRKFLVGVTFFVGGCVVDVL